MELSIGALSKATGVPTNTLRTWERRYGFPVAARSEGGQRVYPAATVDRVRLVARGIELGHRPAQLLGATLDDLRRLTGAAPAPRASLPAAEGNEELGAWVGYAAALDGESLVQCFRSELSRVGLSTFLSRWAGPFLEAIGHAWASGSIQPFHEHFAAERLGEFLVDVWRPMAESNAGPLAVLTTLPTERHGLGLHIAACRAAAAGWRVVFLGVDTPLPDIDACVRQSNADAVLVSVSLASNAAQAAWDIASLRARLPPHVRVVVGGAGSPPDEPPAWAALEALACPR